jgi:hypothetical protein
MSVCDSVQHFLVFPGAGRIPAANDRHLAGQLEGYRAATSVRRHGMVADRGLSFGDRGRSRESLPRRRTSCPSLESYPPAVFALASASRWSRPSTWPASATAATAASTPATRAPPRCGCRSSRCASSRERS